MADDRLSALELRIAELESSIRGVSVGGGKIGPVADFSSGSCTNTCTASCTIGCTKGCTGSCARAIEDIAAQVQPAADAASVGASLYRQMARG